MTGCKAMKLSKGLLRTLERESRGDPEVRDRLVSEAVARRWLGSTGVPAWRNPDAPGASGRYSLILADGRRIAVSPLGKCCWSFDGMAAAKCCLLVVVDLQEERAGGCPEGFLHLSDLLAWADPERMVDFGKTGLRPAGDIGTVLHPARRPRLANLLGTLRLLIAGEPEAPAPQRPGHSFAIDSSSLPQ
jgi:hypothetical protein